jgi:hypothetical protein
MNTLCINIIRKIKKDQGHSKVFKKERYKKRAVGAIQHGSSLNK